MGLKDRLTKTCTVEGASVLSESEFFDERFFDSGIPAMNIAFSGKINGGITSGSTVFAGESKTGKTLFMHLCAKQFLDNHPNGYYVLYDCEFGSNKNTFDNIGLDSERVIHIPVEHVEQFNHDAINMIKEIKKEDDVIIGVDSFGEIASKKELDDTIAGNEKTDMTRAKRLNSYFRIAKPLLNKRDIPQIGIGKTYKTQEMFAKDVLAGGQGITKQSDSIIFITKSKVKEKVGGKDVQVGSSFNVTVNKGRLVSERTKVNIVIYDDHRGLYKYSSIFDIGLELGFIEKITAQLYEIPSVESAKGKRKILDTDKYMSQLCENEEFRLAVEKKFMLNGIHSFEEGDGEIDITEEIDEPVKKEYKLKSK